MSEELGSPGAAPGAIGDENEGRLAFPRVELRARTARGGLLNGLFLGGTEGLVLLQGLIVTAILGPSEVGLYGIVTTTAMTIVQLRRVGIDEAFVQQDAERQEDEFEAAFTLELAIALVAAAAIAVAAPILALVYGETELLPLTLAVAYLPVAFALQAPQWIFFRRMDFLRVRLLQSAIPVVTFAVTVPLAASGFGVWSLVVGPLAGNAVSVLAGLRLSPYRLGLRVDRDAWSRYLRFSLPIFLTSLATLGLQMGQVALFGLSAGLAAAGYITLAMTLTRYADRADQIVATTIYPAICAVRERTRTLEELFEKSNRLTLMWTLPFCASVILFGADLVHLVLGDDWDPAIPLLVGLAAAAALQQLFYNWFSFYRARGRSGPQAVESLALFGGFVVFAVPGELIGGSWWFVAGRIAASALMLAVRTVYVKRLLPGVGLVRLAARSVLPVALAAAPVLVVRAALWGGERTALQAVLELALWVGALVALTWTRERRLLGELRTSMRIPGEAAA